MSERETTEDEWAIERPGFLGTVRQLTDCAKCGEPIRGGRNEPRHYAYIGTPKLHCICNDCYESFPEGTRHDHHN